MIGTIIRITAAAVRIIPAAAFVAIASYVGLAKLMEKKK